MIIEVGSYVCVAESPYQDVHPQVKSCISSYKGDVRVSGKLLATVNRYNYGWCCSDSINPFLGKGYSPRVNLLFVDATLKWLGWHNPPETTCLRRNWLSYGGTCVDYPFTIASSEVLDLSYRLERQKLFKEYEDVVFEPDSFCNLTFARVSDIEDKARECGVTLHCPVGPRNMGQQCQLFAEGGYYRTVGLDNRRLVKVYDSTNLMVLSPQCEDRVYTISPGEWLIQANS